MQRRRRRRERNCPRSITASAAAACFPRMEVAECVCVSSVVCVDVSWKTSAAAALCPATDGSGLVRSADIGGVGGDFDGRGNEASQRGGFYGRCISTNDDARKTRLPPERARGLWKFESQCTRDRCDGQSWGRRILSSKRERDTEFFPEMDVVAPFGQKGGDDNLASAKHREAAAKSRGHTHSGGNVLKIIPPAAAAAIGKRSRWRRENRQRTRYLTQQHLRQSWSFLYRKPHIFPTFPELLPLHCTYYSRFFVKKWTHTAHVFVCEAEERGRVF